MKNLLRIEEMMQYLPRSIKEVVTRVAKDSGQKVDNMELHRHGYSEKSTVPIIGKRQSLKYVSARTQDRDDEIIIPHTIQLKEFMKYGSVLVNHNYSLLPVGSDEWIEADDFGIKALTTHADTGEGTLANVVWKLVEQGHMKASSIGFVPTSFTKPGARDWDHVANQLQSNWKEFDKKKAEKSVSRIITGGVLLEHSFVSVPCNTDAEMLTVMKGFNLAEKVVKQLGFDPIIITKGGAPAVPVICDECGYKAKGQPGDPCGKEGCKGKMKLMSEEKAYNINVLKKGDGETVGSDEDGGYVADAGSKPSVCSECGKKKKAIPGSDCSEEGCKGKMEEGTGEKSVKAVEDQEDTSLPGMLKEILGKTFNLYKQAHIAHWNVVGPDFTEWHSLFGEIYADVWGSVDPLAENIRKLGETVSPVTVLADPEAPGSTESTDPKALAIDLLVSLSGLIDEIKEAFIIATDTEEQGIANFLADRQDACAKWVWQLKASLGLKGFTRKGEVSTEIKVYKPAPVVKVLHVPLDTEGISLAVKMAMSRRSGKLL